MSKETHQESAEHLHHGAEPWLGGMFEVAGGIRLQRNTFKKNGYTYVFPQVRYQDNTEKHIDRLVSTFGGSKLKRTDVSWQWTVSGKNAAHLASLIEPYTPSNQETIAAIHNWDQAESNEERLMVYDDWNASPRKDLVTKEEYMALAKNRAFVAGIYDARGGVYVDTRSYKEESRKYQYFRAYIRSTNQAIFEAINEMYGGTITRTDVEGGSREIQGKQLINRKSVYQLHFTGKDVLAFLSVIQPHILMQKEEVDRTVQALIT